MPTPNQILEQNDLRRCLVEHRDIGHFRWLPDIVPMQPSGIEFVQYELSRLYEQHGDDTFPCQLTHDPTRPRDAHAMQVRTVEHIIGYVPAGNGSWWQRQFDLLGDPYDRLVGLCRIQRTDNGQLGRFEPHCEFRVRTAALQPVMS